jgi:hypothetical protein
MSVTDESVSQRQEPTPASVRPLEAIAMLLLGVINNLFWLIISSSSQRIVDHYGASKNIGLIYFSATICSLFASSINTWLSTNSFSYDSRFIANSVFMAIGLLGCAIAPNFWIACIAIVFVGFPCDFGESVALGFLAYIQSEHLVKFWSMGTGSAGILGSGYSILCIAFQDTLDYRISFYALLPLVLVYSLSYFLVLRQPKPDHPALNSQVLLDSEVSLGDSPISYWNCQFLKNISYYFITCDIVYFSQYVIASAFLDCAQTPEIRAKYKYMFPLLGLFQYVGSLAFASSRHFFRCPHLISMAVVQCLNFGVWLTQSMLHWMPMWSQFIFIFLVGSTGGLSYVNTYDMVLNDENLVSKHRELGANFTAWTVLVAVLASSGFCWLAENTFLAPFVPKDD